VVATGVLVLVAHCLRIGQVESLLPGRWSLMTLALSGSQDDCKVIAGENGPEKKTQIQSRGWMFREPM
jgi:hypothetical protein